MKITLISFTQSGCSLEKRAGEGLQALGHETECYTKSVHTRHSGISHVEESLTQWTGRVFQSSDAILFIGASGIAVRSIAPYVKDKKTDPAVLVMDEQGTFVISLLSGHLGGANELTRYLAEYMGAQPVITTATDLNRRFAVDVFARNHHCHISSMKYAKEISSALLAGKSVGMVSTFPCLGKIPGGLKVLREESGEEIPEEIQELGIWIGLDEKERPFSHTLHLIPRILTLGIGCRKGTSMEAIEEAVDAVLGRLQISRRALEQVATIDIKKEEPGLTAFCREYGLELVSYDAEELSRAVGEFHESEFVRSQVGVGSVCERSASLASGNGRIIQEKYALNGVTVAAAVREWSVNFE